MKQTKGILRFVLVGTGSFGPEFASYMSGVGDLVAICDPNPQARKAFQTQTGRVLPEFQNCAEMLKGVAFDAAVITSTNDTHRGATIALARAGKHVFCEKPMANTVAECWDMVRACHSSGVKLMVGHKRRLRPPWARMIELRSTLGPVVAITSCLYYDARSYDHKGWWTEESRCGGILAIAGVHTIDWMRAICGDARSVSAVSGTRIDPRYDFTDTLHVSMEFVTGAIASLNVSLGFPMRKYRESVGIQVVCRNGGMQLNTYLDRIELMWQRRSDASPQCEKFDDLGFDFAYRKELGDFARWITEGSEPCLSWREGLRCVEIMEAARISARQDGKRLQLPLYPVLEGEVEGTVPS